MNKLTCCPICDKKGVLSPLIWKGYPKRVNGIAVNIVCSFGHKFKDFSIIKKYMKPKKDKLSVK